LVNSVALDASGRTAVSGSVDKTVRVWDLTTGGCTRVLEGHTMKVTSVALDASGRTAVSGSYDKTVRVWDLTTGGCTRVLEGHTDQVTSVALDASGRTAVSGSWDTMVRVWDLTTGRCVCVYPTESNVHALSLSGEAHHLTLTVGERAGRVQFFRLEE
jgi:WD40 repeat protein